jgi:hypothetical protein
MVAPFLSHWNVSPLPEAETEKVATAPASTLTEAGCALMEGGSTASSVGPSHATRSSVGRRRAKVQNDRVGTMGRGGLGMALG